MQNVAQIKIEDFFQKAFWLDISWRQSFLLQLEERDKKRKADIEKRIREERQEEDRIRKEREREKQRYDEEQKKKKEKEVGIFYSSISEWGRRI